MQVTVRSRGPSGKDLIDSIETEAEPRSLMSLSSPDHKGLNQVMTASGH